MRYALRSLFKSPAFTVTAIVTVAVAIAANVALYSVFSVLVLHPIDLPNADRLVRIWSENPARHLSAPVYSVPKYRALTAEQTSFSSIAASAFSSAVITRRGVDAAQLNVLVVTRGFLPTTELGLSQGRNFTADEDQLNGPHVAIISYDLWTTRFGRQPDVVGSTIELDGVPTTVVGVLQQKLPAPIATVQVLRPYPFTSNYLTEQQIQGGAGFLQVTARLKPGVTIAAAQRDVDAASKHYREMFPGRLDGTTGASVHTWTEEQVGPLGKTFTMLLTAVAFVLLIACANVSNLFLGRLLRRRKEVAIRLSLGATPWRVVHAFVMESLVFCVLAGGLGLALAAATAGLVERLLMSQFQITVSLPFDWRVLGVTAGLSIAACFVIGLIPALHATEVRLAEALRENIRGTIGGARSAWLRGALIVGEVALSAVLLVGSSLLLVSFLKLQRTQAGFSPRGIASAFVSLSPDRYPTRTARSNFYYRVMDELRSYPGVKYAVVTQSLPLTGLGLRGIYEVQGRPSKTMAERPIAVLALATEDYFRMLSIPLKQGRVFTTTDVDGGTRVCIINESMAKALFPDGNALGQTILLGQTDVPWQIVGVVGDVKSAGLNTPAPETIYSPLRQVAGPGQTIVASTDRDPATLEPLLRRAVEAVDKSQAVSGFATLDSQLAQSLGIQRMTAWITGAFGIVALFLSALGIYSVLAYAVAQRASEMSLRIALGADRGNVVGLVLRQGMRLALVGLVIGLGAAAAGGRLLGSLLYEVAPLDPAVFTAVGAVFMLVAGVACLMPALRASRADALDAFKAG